MVQLDHGYYICSNKKSFQLVVDKKRIDKKSGKTIFAIKGYYPTFMKALESYANLMVAEYVHDHDCNLSAITKEIENINNSLKIYKISENTNNTLPKAIVQEADDSEADFDYS